MEVPLLTVEEAIAPCRTLHRKQVRVRGVLSLAFEDHTLRPPGMRKRSREGARLWVRLPSVGKDKREAFKKESEDALVEIVGTLDADDHGHMRALPATIRDIVELKRVSQELRREGPASQ